MDELLSSIGSPADLKKLTIPQLTQLAEEIRGRLIMGVSKTGGHIGPNLGVVELTLALHYVFDTPRDSFVFDVSHQAYVHKLLTGRNDRFERGTRYGGRSRHVRRQRAYRRPVRRRRVYQRDLVRGVEQHCRPDAQAH